MLQALDIVAKRPNVTFSAIATRYVLDIPSAKAVIVGSRLSANYDTYIKRNLQAFIFKITTEDYQLVQKAQEGLIDMTGDCRDKYKRPSYLTAAGDLSQHVKHGKKNADLTRAIGDGQRVEYTSESVWESIAVSTHRLCTSTRF